MATDASASVSGEARGGTFGAGGSSSLGEELFSAEAAMLGLASSGVCSLGMSGAVVFCRQRRERDTELQQRITGGNTCRKQAGHLWLNGFTDLRQGI